MSGWEDYKIESRNKSLDLIMGGTSWYPQYAVDQFTTEWLEVKEILKGHSDIKIAAWFESTSSFLGGRKPRDILLTEPNLVIEAARDHMLAER